MTGIDVRAATEADVALLADFRTRMFREMGYGDAELAKLKEAGVTSTTPAIGEI